MVQILIVHFNLKWYVNVYNNIINLKQNLLANEIIIYESF